LRLKFKLRKGMIQVIILKCKTSKTFIKNFEAFKWSE
jgi:hypothetical protein